MAGDANWKEKSDNTDIENLKELIYTFFDGLSSYMQFASTTV